MSMCLYGCMRTLIIYDKNYNNNIIEESEDKRTLWNILVGECIIKHTLQWIK